MWWGWHCLLNVGSHKCPLIWFCSRCGNPDAARSSERWMDEQECVNVTFERAGQGSVTGASSWIQFKV